MNYRKVNSQEFVDLLKSEEGEANGVEVESIYFLTEFINATKEDVFIIKNCKFSRGGDLSKLKVRGRLIFKDCIFEGDDDDIFSFKNISNHSSSHLIISQSNVFKVKTEFINVSVVKLWVAGTFEKQVRFHRCASSIHLNGGEETSKYTQVTFSGCEELKSLLIRDSKVSDYLSFQASVPKQLTICDGDYEIINFHNISSIPYLKIEGGDKDREKLKIGELRMQYMRQEGEINIKFCQIGILNLQEYASRGGLLRFRGVDFLKEAHMEDSELRDVQFNDVSFLNSSLFFDRSFISEAIFSNITWTKKHLVFPDYAVRDRKLSWKSLLKNLKEVLTLSYSRVITDQEHSILKIQREIYRQLKNVSLANHNTVDALAFYKNEMNVYWLDIKFHPKKSMTGLNGRDRLLIGLNKYVSNFGQSWFLPLVWITITTVIYYFIVEQPTLSYYPKDIGNGILEVLYYVNPVRRIDADLTKSAQGLDVLFRVLNAYFIYHFIKASRKFGKV